jgi:hypothetical protein
MKEIEELLQYIINHSDGFEIAIHDCDENYLRYLITKYYEAKDTIE